MSDSTASTSERSAIPDHVPHELIHELDHWNGADFVADPLGFWDDIRDEKRVFWSPLHGGFWCLTRYEDIHEAFRRPDLFSNRLINIPGREVTLLPISLDPPEHTPYRRVLNRPFAPQRVEELRDKVTARCIELIDAVIDKESCEFMSDFAQALPTQVFIELLGLPADKIDTFLDWNHTILHVHGDEEGQARQVQANAELAAYLQQLLEQNREEPGDNLISTLLDSRVNDAPIPDPEILGFLHLLFMAGLDTVTSALGWCWKFLAEHPADRQMILDDPGLIPEAIEEMLRYHAFVEDSRTVTQDVEFAGVQMKEGDRIMLPTSSAGRDEQQFPNAMKVDFHRDPNRHIAFASGPHRCLGSHLARLEMTVAMEEWHRRIPHYQITDGEQVAAHGGAVVGLDRMPLTFKSL